MNGSESPGDAFVQVKSGRPRYELPNWYREHGQIDPKLRAKIRACVNGSSPWPLFVHGETGSGKTLASLVLCDRTESWYLRARGVADLLIQAQQGELQWSTGHKRTEGEVWRDLADVTVLVIDELGSAKTTDFERETLLRLLEIRKTKATILISNFDVAELAKPNRYCHPIASRLSGGTVIAVNGDRRMPPDLKVRDDGRAG